MKTNSESEENKLLSTAAFLVAETRKRQDKKLRKVEKNCIGNDG